jgi:hypothetical protein
VKEVEAENVNVHNKLVKKQSGQLRNLGSFVSRREAAGSAVARQGEVTTTRMI